MFAEHAHHAHHQSATTVRSCDTSWQQERQGTSASQHQLSASSQCCPCVTSAKALPLQTDLVLNAGKNWAAICSRVPVVLVRYELKQ